MLTRDDTAVITDIAVERYKVDFTAVPYITYKDAQGNEHTFYGEQYSAIVYDTAFAGIEEETYHEVINVLQNAIDQYDSLIAD